MKNLATQINEARTEIAQLVLMIADETNSERVRQMYLRIEALEDFIQFNA